MIDEIALINNAKNGDLQAFEMLILEHEAVVYNLAYKTFNNPEDASDVAQEVFIKVFKNIDKFHGNSKFSTWLYKITYNVCIDEIRKRKKTDSRSIDEMYDDSSDAKLVLVDKNPNPLQQTLNNEKTQIINDAINGLTPDSRAAIILRDVNGLSYDEISKIQSCSLGTIKSRINRARQQLKEKISVYLEQNHNF